MRPDLIEIARNKQITGLGHVTAADMKRIRVCCPTKSVLAGFDRHTGPMFEMAFRKSIKQIAVHSLSFLDNEACHSNVDWIGRHWQISSQLDYAPVRITSDGCWRRVFIGRKENADQHEENATTANRKYCY